MRKQKWTTMTNEHTFLEKYTSHTLCKRVVCERWVGDWTDCSILPQVPLSLAALLSHSAGLLNRGSWGPSPLLGAGSHCLELQLELQLQLTPTNSNSEAPGYISVWCPPAFCERHICTEFNPSTVKAISWCLRPDAPISRLTAGSKVNMLLSFHNYFSKFHMWNFSSRSSPSPSHTFYK